MNKKYVDLIELILSSGYEYEDPNRKGVKRKQIDSYSFKHNLLEEGFPFITVKQTYPELALKELELFISGETDIREYWKIGVNFWDKDWKRFIREDQDKSREELQNLPERSYQLSGIYPDLMTSWGNKGINQIDNLLQTLHKNPMATKKTVTMWNPEVKGVLSPCHWAFEVIVSPIPDAKEGEPQYYISLKFHMGSSDVFLGKPMNVVYYAGLLVWLAHVSDMIPLNLYGDLSNVHLYDNSWEAAEDLLKQPYEDIKVDVEYNPDMIGPRLANPFWDNFKWDKSKVVMGKRYNVPMLTYNK